MNSINIYADVPLVVNNQKVLISYGIEFSIFSPTNTGLKKSILDATGSVRTHFELENFHFYYQQKQGIENKITKSAYLLTSDKTIDSIMSLYRPTTKKGDPRMWFKHLKDIANSDDYIAVIIKDGNAYLINLSQINLEDNDNKNVINQFLSSYKSSKNSISEELLSKLKVLAKAPFPSQRRGDTGIGYTLETLLGIEANNSKKPDYYGIELKAGRGNKTRTTIFAQVADWSISPCKRSADILERYGYKRDDNFKLYCTISSQRINSQGLHFKINLNEDQLEEWHNDKDLVAIWPGNLLRRRLKEKHTETFWIEANSLIINGIEHFQLRTVTHTKSPIMSQLIPLLSAGVITMDHLIKRDGKTNKVSEKGPLFKLNKRDLDLLFPLPQTYILA
ncbi:MvaI/BcnI family restriction endonuclease [Photobacterium phosphoreum]|uniref:MvaI/BcnI family restriction endonuclease n=1 Tax=Photobacterium phosphoreum TaxID=659 RepID=UPI001E30E408